MNGRVRWWAVVAAMAMTVAFVGAMAEAAEIPKELRAEVRQAELIGRQIFEKDRAAWMATDELMRAGIPEKDSRVRGWVTVPDGEGWRVRFVGEDGGELRALYDIRFPEGRAVITALAPAEELPSSHAAMFAARQTGVQALKEWCSESYNTVVVPAKAIGAEGWLVYLLAASTVAGEIMAGGHHRMHVSEDGTTLLSDTPLSRSCLRIPPPPAGEGVKEVMPYMTHLVTQAPVETHVFLSLSHGMSLYVSTDAGIWVVDGDRIRYVEAHEKDSGVE